MLKALKFVQGAVAKKDFVPVLTHFEIKNGFVYGYNGEIGLCSPITVDINCTPNAKQFIKALNSCEDKVSLSLIKNKLVVKSGLFKANVDCVAESNFPNLAVSGEGYTLENGLLEGFEALSGFISEDASRPWSQGIKISGQSFFATNNIALAEYWYGWRLFENDVTLPVSCINEFLRIGKEPKEIYFNGRTVYFVYEDGSWLSSQIIQAESPNYQARLEKDESQADEFLDYKTLKLSLERLYSHTDDLKRVYFSEGRLSTHSTENEGVVIQCPHTPSKGIYNAETLLKILRLEGVRIGLENYPAPVGFYSDKIRGLVVGMVK